MKYSICMFFIMLILTGCSSVKYSIKAAYSQLENDDFTVINSDKYGSIQYKITGEAGVPVLVIHGICGGYDQGIQTGIGLLPENRKIISVSRFGYLKSSFPDHPDPANQCKAYIEVLDSNNIEKVFLLATSAGGTIAFKFALLYPERVAGLILVGSGYPSQEQPKGPKGPPAFIYSDRIFGFMINNMQGTLLKMFGVSKEEYNVAPPDERKNIDELFKTILPINPRRKGIINDERVTNSDMIIYYSEYPIETIDKPFLILHAENDPMAKYATMASAVKRLKNAETVVYEKGGHVLFGHSAKNRRYVADFIERWSE